MKSISALSATLLLAGSALATVIPSNGILPGAPPSRRAAEDVDTHVPGCNADNVLRALRNPTRSVGASTFCSGFLQPTVTSTSTVTIDNTNTITSLTTETTTTTTIATESIVATVTCAASSPTAVTCNVEAYGFGTNLIDQTTGVDPIDCHEHCLANPACKSFQVQTGAQRTCNIFKVATAGNVQAAPGSGFTFFDRNCIDYLPAQCTPAAMPKMAKRAASIPSYLATVPATRISSACSCFIASPSPTFTNVVFESMTVQLYTTTTLDTTITATETDSTTVSATAVVTAAP